MIHVSVVVHFPVDLQPTEMVPASHQGNSIILNFPKKFLVKADIKQLSPKKKEVLMKIEGIQAISVLDGRIPPPLGLLGLINSLCH